MGINTNVSKIKNAADFFDVNVITSETSFDVTEMTSERSCKDNSLGIEDCEYNLI